MARSSTRGPKQTPAQVLVERSRARFADLGADVAPGCFVCPLCLRLLAETEATQGHYPAKRLPADHRSELLCADCNSFLGQAYEADAVDYLNRTYRLAVGSPGGRKITGRATMRREPSGAIQIATLSGGAPGNRGMTSALDAVRARSDVPHVLDFELSLPAEEQAKRALLAWSFLDWFFYAGYRYVASSGAEIVRRVILDPSLPLPAGTFFQKEEAQLPLPAPRPVLLVRATKAVASLEDIDEFVGIGTAWGQATAVLPFANDEDDGTWRTVAQLLDEDHLRTLVAWPMREMLSVSLIDKGLHADMVISGEGQRHVISEALTGDALAALARGESPRRMTPSRAGLSVRRLVPSTEQRFSVVGSPAFGGPPIAWRWVRCRLDLFDQARLRAMLRRGSE